MLKNKRFVIVGDNHGDEEEPDLVEKFFAWLDDWRPDLVIHGGDNWNFAALRTKANADEKTIAIAPDYEAGVNFAKRLFAHGSKRYFTRGNHDERIYRLAAESKDAATQHAASQLCNDTDALMCKLRVKVLPYDSRLGVLDANGVRSIHGYSAGVSAARKFASVYGTCSYNHTHSMEVGVYEQWPETAVAYGVGCLLKIDQGYNAHQIAKLRHENGWLYGETNGKRAVYFQAKFKDGKVYAAPEFKAY